MHLIPLVLGLAIVITGCVVVWIGLHVIVIAIWGAG
jgi:hypothetical protein